MHNGRSSNNWLITTGYQPITIRIAFLFLFFFKSIFLLKMISILGFITYLDDNEVIHVSYP
jgi:hypothetical protein